MQLWSGPSTVFVSETTHNRIAELLRAAFFQRFRHQPSSAEVASWQNSLRALSLVMQDAALNDHGVMLEYQLPLSSRRLDCLLCGGDEDGRENAVIIELKQWQTCKEANGENLVTTWVANAERDVLHPSAQVGQYQRYLQDTHTAFHDGPSPVQLASCTYLHNYTAVSGDALFAPRFAALLSAFPAFTAPDVAALQGFLRPRLSGGCGMPVLEKIRQSRYRPSKKLLEHVAGVIAGKPEYVLLDEQLVVFDKVLAMARSGLRSKQRAVLVVHGGPGTGKSVIALNLMSRLLAEGYNAHYATGSRAFTETLRTVIGRRAAPQFMYFNSYAGVEPGNVDVLICDEAHRLRRTSGTRFRPNRTGMPQIEEIISATKLAVFLIDDRQVVRPDEIGSSTYVREHAERLGCDVHEHTLDAQFRCAGSDAFVNWVANTLGIERTANAIWEGDERFDFRIFSSPESLEQAIRARVAQGHSARLAAGFCWPWSKARADGTLVEDVVVGEWRRPWNARPEASKLAAGIPKAQLWAHDPGGLEQVGCVYTAQGFEFDYVGVIFGRDLRYDLDANAWVGDRKASFDVKVKQGGEKFVELVKNTYRVLFSRGLRGCYTCFLDRDTERFFRTRIEGSAAEPRLEALLSENVPEEPSSVEPFRRLDLSEVRPFENCVPLYDLAVAAGAFSGVQEVEEMSFGDEDRRPEDFTWVELPEALRPRRGSFVARVVGDSMNRRIPNGAWCLFGPAPTGSRNGRVVVAQHREISDPDTGGHYTVKVYESRKAASADGPWRHRSVVLKPDTTLPGYSPMVLSPEQADDLRIIAVLVAVLG